MHIENRYRSHMLPIMNIGAKTLPRELKRVTSEQLLGPAKELAIVHNGREYRLRMTQNGKLILTA